MNISIRTIESSDSSLWDAYVQRHSRSTLYHLSGWKNVIEKTYGRKTYYLMAINEPDDSQFAAYSIQQTAGSIDAQLKNYELSANNYEPNSDNVSGILPLVHLKHFIFGNTLVSIPFFDLGGILSDDEETEMALLHETIKLGAKLKIDNIELRHIDPIISLGTNSAPADQPEPSSSFRRSRIEYSQLLPEAENIKRSNQSGQSCRKTERFFTIATKAHKVRMLLELPETSEILMKSFKSKLRSQIKKPLKEGLHSVVGGIELLDDFYHVFSINMRDLGSPVHSKRLMRNVLEEFPEKAKIVIIYLDNQPLACSLIVGFKETLENPWASALREYSRLSPNMLLYWSMLEFGCDNDYQFFDFGRSSPDESTYKFKKQWGAKPTPLHWHYISLGGEPVDTKTSEKSKFEKAIQYWKKLPVSVTKFVGPMIRKNIGL